MCVSAYLGNLDADDARKTLSFKCFMKPTIGCIENRPRSWCFSQYSSRFRTNFETLLGGRQTRRKGVSLEMI